MREYYLHIRINFIALILFVSPLHIPFVKAGKLYYRTGLQLHCFTMPGVFHAINMFHVDEIQIKIGI
jgi:hypothetical protein